MKKAFAAALTISLLAGTSALAQETHQRRDGDWRDRAAQQQQDAKPQQDRRPVRQQPNQTPARPVPQVVNPRAQDAIAQARARQAEHDAAVVRRRNDRPNADGRARQDERQAPGQRYVVPRVIPQPEQRRYDRRDDHRPQPDQRHYDRRGGNSPQPEQRHYDRRDDNRDQHVIIRPDGRRPDDAARRADVERRLREAERNRGRDFQHWSRPGEHELRDRDRGRHWYDPDRWRHSYWAHRQYRAPYRYPPGWYVRTWIFGDFLPHTWYTPTYYLDWWNYGLPMPPIGAEWVRVGDDALLVDTWSGEVLSVYYDLFW